MSKRYNMYISDAEDEENFAYQNEEYESYDDGWSDESEIENNKRTKRKKIDDFSDDIVDEELDNHNDFKNNNNEELIIEDDNEDMIVDDVIISDDCIVLDDGKKMSSEEIATEFIKIMEDYHSGEDKKRKRAKEKACMLMKNFIFSIIHTRYKTYTRQYWDDLCQAGNIGILTALEKYDPEKGKPSTYFYRHIIHEMQAFIDQEINKMTPHYSSNMRKVDKAIAFFENKEKPYTNVDIAIQTNLSIETVNKVLSMKVCREEVHSDSVPVSFLETKMENVKNKTPEEEYVEAEDHKVLYEAIKNLLTDEEKIVLIYSVGLCNCKRLSNKSIAQKFDMPIDKVRKLYASALKKLKFSDIKYTLKDNYEEDTALIKSADVAIMPEIDMIVHYLDELKDADIDLNF